MTESPPAHLLARRAHPAPSVFVREFEGELVLLDMKSGDYFALNDVGHEFWTHLAAGCSVGAAAEHLVARYDVQLVELCQDLCELFDALEARNLLVVELEDSGLEKT